MLVKAWNTGYEGGIITIHLDSAHRSLDRLKNLVAESGEPVKRSTSADAIKRVIAIEASG